MKNTLKILVLVLVMALMVSTFAACGQNEKGSQENESNEKSEAKDVNKEEKKDDKAVEEYEIKLSTSEALDPEISIEAVSALKFKDYLETKSNGQIKVEIYPGGTLGDAESCLEQTKNGVITVASSAAAKIATYYDAIQVFSIPYLFESREKAYDVFDNSQIVKDLVDDMAQKTNLRMIMFGENGGFRCFSNSVREIKTPEDMKGLKIRTMSSPLHMNIVKNLGGIPTPMPWSELYTGLETGVVDGQENAPQVVKLGHLEEVQKYYTLDKHVYSMTTFVINDSWLQSIPEDLKAMVLEAGKEAANAGRQACIDREKDVLKYLEEKGMIIHEPTSEEFAMFREATQQPAMDWLSENVDEKWINGLVEAAK